jgi:hypothetical protein
VILMHSISSTCPQVGATCYPPFLGVTKEIMSRGPQVADMEYRERYQQAEPHITLLITMRSMSMLE